MMQRKQNKAPKREWNILISPPPPNLWIPFLAFSCANAVIIEQNLAFAQRQSWYWARWAHANAFVP